MKESPFLHSPLLGVGRSSKHNHGDALVFLLNISSMNRNAPTV